MNNSQIQPKTAVESIIAFVGGLIFGIGLVVAGMTNPKNVLGFLDVFGTWQPALGLVMGGAILSSMPFFLYAKTRKKSLTGHAMQLPTNHTLNKRLIVGSLAFGAGWGLIGLCPGPAIVVAATGNHAALVFVLSMFIGFALYSYLETRKIAKTRRTTPHF